ncbi:MAG: HNH endonuclease [Selenomonadaceae bacterium]|nr:HNH endonuclease [Selenomonadaceae bacterium]
MNNRPAYEALMKFYPLTVEDLPDELWLPVPDFDKYQVSNFGRVKSFNRSNQRILKPAIVKGYPHVQLKKDRQHKNFYIHRLVAQAFIPNPEGKSEINHRDGNKLNNFVGNLEWATSSENRQHAFDTGLQKSGEERSDSKLTNDQVHFIRENPDGLTTYALADLFGVNQVTISKIQRGKRYKKAGGSVRQSKAKRVPKEIKTQIRAEYQKGVKGCGLFSLAKKYGLAQSEIWRIVNSSNL